MMLKLGLMTPIRHWQWYLNTCLDTMTMILDTILPSLMVTWLWAHVLIIISQSSSKCCDTWKQKVWSRVTCIWSHNHHVFTKLVAIYVESTNAYFLKSLWSMLGSIPFACCTYLSLETSIVGLKIFHVFIRLNATSHWINWCFLS
jgi:hypothetical protein